MKFFQRIFLFVNLLNTIFAQSTPLTLDYKPIKPFYWPANFIYPQPMIPPGTPWPATYTTDALVTNKINSELPIKSNEENRNGLLVPTTFSTVESSTTNIVESSSRSPTEENIFNLLCLIIPCLSTSIHKETENPLQQIVNYTTSSNDIDSTKNDVSVSPSYESSSDKIITPIPDTDIRIKPAETFDPDMIVFPDQLIAATIGNKFEASNILLPAVVSKTSSEECNKTSEELKDKSKPAATDDATLKPPTTTVINLEYKPTRPPHVPNPVFYPQPVIKPDTPKPLAEEVVTSKPVTTTLKPSSTTIIDLEYKPTRPTFIPGPVVYPQPAIKPETSKPLAEEYATSKPSLTTLKPSSTTIIDLEYKPTRPTFIPGPVVYPQPAIKPETSKPLAEEDATSKPSLTTLKPSSTTIIDLEYKPTRPTFIPGPVVYPQPAIKPETSKPLGEEDATSKPSLTTLKPSLTTIIDLEYKPTRPPFIPGPVVYPQPAIKPETSKPLAEEDATSKPSSTTVVNLEYKPTRPTFIPDPVVYPQPAISTSSSVIHSSGSTFSTLSDKFATSLLTNTASPSGNNEITTKRIITTRKPVYSTPISLEYKPTRPPYVPNPIFYPKPAIPPGTPWPAYSTTTSKPSLTTLKPSLTTIIDLEYKPTRPPFIPGPVVYPQPAIKPETSKPLAEEDATSKPSSTIVVNLEYKPTRPTFIPDPVVYPQPAINTSSSVIHSSGSTFSTLSDKFATSLLTNTASPSGNNEITTKRIITTRKPVYSTPISLEYKPTRPPYVPNPIFYPKPAIPPGTPWPAYSTTKSLLTNYNLV